MDIIVSTRRHIRIVAATITVIPDVFDCRKIEPSSTTTTLLCCASSLGWSLGHFVQCYFTWPARGLQVYCIIKLAVDCQTAAKQCDVLVSFVSTSFAFHEIRKTSCLYFLCIHVASPI